jgi:citrate lyase subunit beta / citryl-CoA lyase
MSDSLAEGGFRSALYVGAHSDEFLNAALAARPDAVIVDLEDAVPEERKLDAREALDACTASVRAAGVRLIVRVNGVDTPWFRDDVIAACAVVPEAILLPKAAAPELEQLRRELDQRSSSIQIWALIERVRDVLAVDSIAASGLADVLTIGYGDLCKALGLPLSTRHPEFVGVARLVAEAADSAGKLALDGVVVGRDEAVGLACERSKALGFVGRTLYDPRHVTWCHNAFG